MARVWKDFNWDILQTSVKNTQTSYKSGVTRLAINCAAVQSRSYMADQDLDGTDFDEPEPDDVDGEMPWESHAREAIERVLAEATFDESNQPPAKPGALRM